MLKRYVIIADGKVIDQAFTEEKARKIAFEYEYGCIYQDDSFHPRMEIKAEEIE